jgi:hydroxypyruvate isomerase
MRQFAANISILFPTLPYMDRFRAAAEAGFRTVETWWPDDALAAGFTIDAIVREFETQGLELALLNFAAGDMKGGDRGLAADPQRVEAFRANVPVAIELARRLGCHKLNALAGNVLGDGERPGQLRLLADSLAFAADAAEKAGMSIMVEPLNAHDTPRYLLTGTAAAVELMDRVGRPNILLQFDVYHVVMAGEDPLEAIRRVGPGIGHVQLADVPGRHEPGTGNVPFPAILDALEAAGYHDTYGLEFAPLDPAAPQFGCVERLGGALLPRSGQMPGHLPLSS